MAVRVSQADRGGSLAWRSKLAQAAGLPKSRAPPPRLAAESTAEEPGWLAGWRAGRTGRGGGKLCADGAGPRRAPPPPKDLGTWTARDCERFQNGIEKERTKRN